MESAPLVTGVYFVTLILNIEWAIEYRKQRLRHPTLRRLFIVKVVFYRQSLDWYLTTRCMKRWYTAFNYTPHVYWGCIAVESDGRWRRSVAAFVVSAVTSPARSCVSSRQRSNMANDIRTPSLDSELPLGPNSQKSEFGSVLYMATPVSQIFTFAQAAISRWC